LTLRFTCADIAPFCAS